MINAAATAPESPFRRASRTAGLTPPTALRVEARNGGKAYYFRMQDRRPFARRVWRVGEGDGRLLLARS